jgi:hypothetical protein
MLHFGLMTRAAVRPGGALMRAMRVVSSGLVLAGLLAGALLPAPAQAYWRGHVFFGFPPVYVPPPAYYYPPPVYVTPPPVYVAPPAEAGGPPPPAQACYAGPWVCPLQQATPVGNSCACQGASGPVWGRAH